MLIINVLIHHMMVAPVCEVSTMATLHATRIYELQCGEHLQPLFWLATTSSDFINQSSLWMHSS